MGLFDNPFGPKKNGTVEDVLLGLGEQLKVAALTPNIYKYKPHEKQEKFHNSRAHGRLFIGGNRSGKTVGGGTEMVWYATGKHPYKPTPEPPLRLRVVTVDLIEGLEKIVLPEIKKWLPPSELINGSWEDSWSAKSRTLTLANKTEIEFMTYEQALEKFAGTSRHAIWFDEEPPKDIFDECRARLIDTDGDWWITMTPVEGLTWTYDDIYVPGITGEDDDIFIVEINMDENPHLTNEAIERYFKTMSDDDKKARREGKYVAVGGFIYDKYFSEENIIDPVIPPQSWLHFASLDHGFTNPTCWLWMAVDREGRIIVYDEYYQDRKLVHEHAAYVLENNKKLSRVPAYYVGDPSIRNTDPITGTSVHLEYLEHGIPIVLGNNDQKAGIQAVSRLLEGITVGGVKYPKLYITRDCPNLIKEIKSLRWEVWRNKKDKFEKNAKEEQKKKNDHAADALRYGVASRPQVDSGQSIPSAPMGIEASTAIPIHGPYIDKEAISIGSNRYNDYHLGDEW